MASSFVLAQPEKLEWKRVAHGINPSSVASYMGHGQQSTSAIIGAGEDHPASLRVKSLGRMVQQILLANCRGELTHRKEGHWSPLGKSEKWLNFGWPEGEYSDGKILGRQISAQFSVNNEQRPQV